MIKVSIERILTADSVETADLICIGGLVLVIEKYPDGLGYE